MTAPFDHGYLDAGDGQLIYWETCGNPHGVPALVVHGGPGSGCTPAMRESFDPTTHRTVLFDQRGAGRSLPHASDPATDLSVNTTGHLLADMERLRTHLGIERWLLTGGSWGSTLILAYAQAHPERVRGIVLHGVTTTSRREIDWLYRGAGRFFPAAQEDFLGHVPEAHSDLFGDGGVLDAYTRRCSAPDPEVRQRAARAWCAWEDILIAHEHQGSPGAYSHRAERDQLALVRVASHYFSHAAWLDDAVLLRDVHRLAGIPAALIHGQLDLASPLDTAWQLSQAWPETELLVVDTGHTGSGHTKELVRQARARITDLSSP